jgi:hypothetical protein
VYAFYKRYFPRYFHFSFPISTSAHTSFHPALVNEAKFLPPGGASSVKKKSNKQQVDDYRTVMKKGYIHGTYTKSSPVAQNGQSIIEKFSQTLSSKMYK